MALMCGPGSAILLTKKLTNCLLTISNSIESKRTRIGFGVQFGCGQRLVEIHQLEKLTIPGLILLRPMFSVKMFLDSSLKNLQGMLMPLFLLLFLSDLFAILSGKVTNRVQTSLKDTFHRLLMTFPKILRI